MFDNVHNALTNPLVIALASPETKAAHAALIAGADRKRDAIKAVNAFGPALKRRNDERLRHYDLTPNAALDAAEEEYRTARKALPALEREFDAIVRADTTLTAAIVKARTAAKVKRDKSRAALDEAEHEVERLEYFEAVRKPTGKTAVELQNEAVRTRMRSVADAN